MRRRRRSGAGALAAGVLALALAVGTGAPAAADPAAGPVPTTPAPRPSADPSLPTPTTPHPGHPPQGSAPDGSTVGGDDLDTRGTVVTPGAPPLPDGVVAAGWLVADATDGTVLAARDPHGRYYPASTLKLLTLLALAPELDPEQVVEGTVEDEAVEGSRVGLVAGGRYPVRLLEEALILQSGNDAANALARAYGGTPAALRAMAAVAEDLGAFDTVVGSTSGLDVAGQSSSPYDLALILRAVLADEDLAALLTVRTARMPPVRGRSPGYQIQNQNPLLDDPGNLGGKTGFTDAARHTFVTAAERGGRRLVVSVMRSPARPLRAADQAALLLDWGFTVPAGGPGVGRLVDAGEVPADPPPAPPPATSASASPVGPEGPEGPEGPSAAAPPAPADGGFPLVPVALGAAALLALAASGPALRRRLLVRRRPRPPGPTGAAPGPPGGTPSTPP